MSQNNFNSSPKLSRLLNNLTDLKEALNIQADREVKIEPIVNDSNNTTQKPIPTPPPTPLPDSRIDGIKK